jgi:hypothetical protein
VHLVFFCGVLEVQPVGPVPTVSGPVPTGSVNPGVACVWNSFMTFFAETCSKIKRTCWLRI